MVIGGLQKVTLVDYPGKIACTVFLSGCNFRCPFCYSKELVLPEEIRIHPQIDEDYFFHFLDGKNNLLEGCVLCGGEPTIYGQELVDFTRKIKEKEFFVKLDTNGTNPDVIKKLIDEKLVDYIAMDIKAPLNKEKYEINSGTKGVALEKIKESIFLIKNSGINYEFRTTVVHGLHSREDIIQMAEDISPADKYYLQNFRAEKGVIDSKFDNVKPFEDDFMKSIEEEIKNKFKVFKIR
ncbi:MAG: anaerobic ribonucleoside-triphosphate reductase activating protein [Candidatus Pacebacteria bacterium]|nr:anaerobic ribonucleoside-triphosphate reductase activating protein [Candidatus Paceibacterota bacterium]